MTLVLLLAAFLAIVLAFGVLVAVHDGLETLWRRTAGRRIAARGRFVTGAAAPRPEAPAAAAHRARPRGGAATASRTWVPSAAAHARAWRHLH